MQTVCTHCGQQHLLNDALVAKYAKVQFRCTQCGQVTVVSIKRPADQTVVISPMPSFARSDTATATLKLPPAAEGLHLPTKADVVLTVTDGPEKGKTFTLVEPRLVIGRTGADLALNDPEISRHHCLVEVRDRFTNLKDLDSTNGTFFRRRACTRGAAAGWGIVSPGNDNDHGEAAQQTGKRAGAELR
jgi:hypothetical protein